VPVSSTEPTTRPNQFGTRIAHHNLAALDPTTGVATAWNPNVNGQVNTVTLVDGRIYVGNSFLQIDDENRERLAELDPAATVSGNAGGPYPISSPALPGTITGTPTRL
jgi:hypothetical protein